MKSLRETIEEAAARGAAIGHFNISELAAFEGIARAVRATGLPAIIGTSEGEREFIGAAEAAALVQALRAEGLPVYLNADHHHSLEKIKEAVAAGYDAVLFDGGKLPVEENITRTREVVEYVRSVDPNILIEGELGFIGSGSEVRDKAPEGAALSEGALTTPEEAARFVQETGVDMLAPAVGNFHGMVTGGTHKEINIERVRAIKAAAQVPLVLHGGSGTADETFRAAIQAGINIVHVSTELRAAWRQEVEESLKEMPTEVAPSKLLAASAEEIEKIVTQRLKLFAGI
ncbi:MAG: tagatose-bisphosphate aldolase [Candidatus Liptonbacteria bacterium RIFCSPHIGHO2_01_FULL_57_28]|uniref:Tagatose-bisphosphate aldolase n=1 Tax=Candidatus Liptonbacteria bacterium RIFCSPHIGHO2_01_FULL_57_28 TaxID=1798647 RepID=A0A1G2C936_9BACT|nr:MAG: tagatose-bisphosphate aldolase [Candidatus Liptonbacteria bacterium RIFCSPHIGHO2_01_FULL_57_28]